MATDRTLAGSTTLSPDEAFSILGNEARLGIVRTLGEADDPLTYSELFERIDYDDRSNFSYHLDQLTGHFVGKTGAGYTLRRPGERIMEAVLSGAVTSDPVRQRTQTDRPCPFCSGPIEVGYEQERVTMHCPECSGLVGERHSDTARFEESGNLGFRPLPPAAVEGRSASEMHDASKVWTAINMHAVGRGMCPRCSGAVTRSVDVCEAHESIDGSCEQCGRHFAGIASANCTNCIFEMQAGIAAHLGATIELMEFLIEQGIDPLAPEEFHPYAAVEENIQSTDPFFGRYTFTIESESLTLSVDEQLSVKSVDR